MNSILKVKNLKKSYQDKVIFEKISFDLHENQIISILGPSGIGKTTLLNVISGIDKEFDGSINLNSKNHHSKENFAFSQSKDLLIPWKNVIDNAVFSLELSGVKKEKSYGFHNFFPCNLADIGRNNRDLHYGHNKSQNFDREASTNTRYFHVLHKS